MKKIVYFHIGYPKTSTTSLQRFIFPLLRGKGFYYAGRSESVESREIIRSVFSHFEVDEKEIDTEIVDPFMENEKVLFSNEYIVSVSFGYGYDLADVPTQIRKISERLQADDVRIILTFRKQSSLAHSVYANGCEHFKKNSNVDTFPKYMEQILRPSSQYSKPYHYAEIAAQLFAEFGKDKVHINFYEQLGISQGVFLSDLYNFLGVDGLPFCMGRANQRTLDQNSKLANPKVASWVKYLAALKNYLLPGSSFHMTGLLQRLALIKPQVVFVEELLLIKIEREFVESNKRLAGLIGIELDKFGYY